MPQQTLQPQLGQLQQHQQQQQQSMHSTFLPPPGTVPPDVLQLLSAAQPEDRKAVGLALKALYDCGVGGTAMRWAAIQAMGKKMPDEEIEDLFTTVKGYVLQGKIEEAAEWVKEIKESQ